jgi:hypothetical protein
MIGSSSPGRKGLCNTTAAPADFALSSISLEPETIITGILQSRGSSRSLISEWERSASVSQKDSAQLVLPDLNMPILDGWGFLSSRQNNPPTRETPLATRESSFIVDDQKHWFPLNGGARLMPPSKSRLKPTMVTNGTQNASRNSFGGNTYLEIPYQRFMQELIPFLRRSSSLIRS